jgi:hypothetical protein
LVNTFPEFSQNSFEKRQVATFPFTKELCANQINTSTNRIRGIALSCLQKIWVLKGKNLLIQYNIKERIKK